MRLLLGSGGLSTTERREVWIQEINDFLGPIQRVVFLPYAGSDYKTYLNRMNELKLAGNRELEGLHEATDPQMALNTAEAIFVGGGNTFRLLNTLYQQQFLKTIQQRVQAGIPYIGISAGTNMACPTMRTTNDMPIVQPPSLDALGFIPFQINPHYFAGAIHYETPQGLVRYGGETRDDRLREFHEMNAVPVLGLWEGSILRVEDGRAELKGLGGGRIFRKGQPVEDRPVGASVADLF